VISSPVLARVTDTQWFKRRMRGTTASSI
jgi:hypothetical protein